MFIIRLTAPQMSSDFNVSFMIHIQISMIEFQQSGLQCYANDVAEVLPFALTSNQRQNCDFQLNPLVENARWEEVWEEQRCLLDEAVVTAAVEDATDVAAAEMFVVAAAAAAAEIDVFERDVAVVDDNLQNTNHVAVETQTSSCLMLWLRSDYHVETCLPNEMRSELSVQLNYSVVGYVKNVDEKSTNDD